MAAMADATSRRKQLDSWAAAIDPIAAAKRDFVAPGIGALQTIPIAAVMPKVSPFEIALEPVCQCFAGIDPTELPERLPHYHSLYRAERLPQIRWGAHMTAVPRPVNGLNVRTRMIVDSFNLGSTARIASSSLRA